MLSTVMRCLLSQRWQWQVDVLQSLCDCRQTCVAADGLGGVQVSAFCGQCHLKVCSPHPVLARHSNDAMQKSCHKYINTTLLCTHAHTLICTAYVFFFYKSWGLQPEWCYHAFMICFESACAEV